MARAFKLTFNRINMTGELIFEQTALSQMNWESKRDNLKRRFPALSDADLFASSDGSLHNVAMKLGLSSDELQIVILTS